MSTDTHAHHLDNNRRDSERCRWVSAEQPQCILIQGGEGGGPDTLLRSRHSTAALPQGRAQRQGSHGHHKGSPGFPRCLQEGTTQATRNVDPGGPTHTICKSRRRNDGDGDHRLDQGRKPGSHPLCSHVPGQNALDRQRSSSPTL